MYVITLEHKSAISPVQIIWDNIQPAELKKATQFEQYVTANATAIVLARKLGIGYASPYTLDKVVNPNNSPFVLKVKRITNSMKLDLLTSDSISNDTTIMVDDVFFALDDAGLFAPEIAYVTDESSQWTLSPCNVFEVNQECEVLIRKRLAY